MTLHCMNVQFHHHETNGNDQGKVGDESPVLSLLTMDRRHQMSRTYAYFVHVDLTQHPRFFPVFRREVFRQRQVFGGHRSGRAL
jgi:hypothetical protein